MRLPGPWELAIILAIVLVIFGAGRLPEIGASLGRSMRSFRRGISGKEEDGDSAETAENAPRNSSNNGSGAG